MIGKYKVGLIGLGTDKGINIRECDNVLSENNELKCITSAYNDIINSTNVKIYDD